jgi:hypothetical protein
MAYFVEVSIKGPALCRVAIAGGDIDCQALPLSTPTVTDVTGDGSRFLVLNQDGKQYEDQIWIFNRVNGSLVRVGQVFAAHALWLGNGARILFASQSSVFTMNQDGTEVRKLLSVGGRVGGLYLSPDGSRFRVLVFDPQEDAAELLEAGIDGQGLHRIAPGIRTREVDLPPFWTAEGKGYSLIQILNGTPFLTGWQDRSIPTQPGVHDIPLSTLPRYPRVSSVASSSDGKHLIAMLVRMSRGELYKVDVRSGEFLPFFRGISAMDLDFSTQGDDVAYRDLGDDTLWQCKSNGSERLRLTSPPLRAELPKWSPDGKLIAFMGHLPGNPMRVYLVPAGGGTPREAVSNDSDNEGAPTWSPDGQSLMFANVNCEPTHSCAIHVVNLKTGAMEMLPESQGLRTARWSPNGRYVAALEREMHELKLFSFKTHSWRTLSDRATSDDVNWSRDSQNIFIYDIRPEDPGVIRVNVASRRAELVASLKDVFLLSGDAQRWFGLAPDDSPIIYREMESPELYSFDWLAH